MKILYETQILSISGNLRKEYKKDNNYQKK
jgi:hypothetical protein